MANRCKDCKHDKGRCVGSTRRGSHQYCFVPIFMTNADRIRSMTDDELEAFLIDVDLERAGSPFISNWGKWLREPAEVDNGKSNDQK